MKICGTNLKGETKVWDIPFDIKQIEIDDTSAKRPLEIKFEKYRDFGDDGRDSSIVYISSKPENGEWNGISLYNEYNITVRRILNEVERYGGDEAIIDFGERKRPLIDFSKKPTKKAEIVKFESIPIFKETEDEFLLAVAKNFQELADETLPYHRLYQDKFAQTREAKNMSYEEFLEREADKFGLYQSKRDEIKKAIDLSLHLGALYIEDNDLPITNEKGYISEDDFDSYEEYEAACVGSVGVAFRTLMEESLKDNPSIFDKDEFEVNEYGDNVLANPKFTKWMSIFAANEKYDFLTNKRKEFYDLERKALNQYENGDGYRSLDFLYYDHYGPTKRQKENIVFNFADITGLDRTFDEIREKTLKYQYLYPEKNIESQALYAATKLNNVCKILPDDIRQGKFLDENDKTQENTKKVRKQK